MTNPNTVCYKENAAQHVRRQSVIAGGVNSNVRLSGTPVPLTFSRADGALLWDVDDNVYVDYAAGMGPMVLGHNHPAVTSAVRDSLASGQLFAGQKDEWLRVESSAVFGSLVADVDDQLVFDSDLWRFCQRVGRQPDPLIDLRLVEVRDHHEEADELKREIHHRRHVHFRRRHGRRLELHGDVP